MGESDHRVSKSLYAKDPSGIEFEVMWRVPAGDWAAEMADGGMILPLDLEAELARWGRDQVTGAAAATHLTGLRNPRDVGQRHERPEHRQRVIAADAHRPQAIAVGAPLSSTWDTTEGL